MLHILISVVVKGISDYPPRLQTWFENTMSFQTLPSHYCRKTSSRQYLPSELNVRKMYRMYVELCKERRKKAVKESFYRHIFVSEFNISFQTPKKDKCNFCVAYLNYSKQEQEAKRPDYESHTRNKEQARQMKTVDKEKAKTDSQFAAACFDLQQVLQCPFGDVNLFYYKRKLSVYNLSIYGLGDGRGLCYMWDETTAARGSCEISSCVMDYLKKCSEEGKERMSLYSDNCGGQNRNRYVVVMYSYIVQSTAISNITHTFLEKGHTQNENDSIHAVIENEKKHTEFVYTPAQYYALARCAQKSKQQYTVKEMEREDCFNFKAMAKQMKNFSVDEDGESVRWGKIRQLVLDKSHPYAVKFKHELDAGAFRILNMFRKSRKKPITPTLELLYSEPLPVKKSKYKYLLALCNEHLIPSAYHSFFRDLPNEDRNDSDENEVEDDNE